MIEVYVQLIINGRRALEQVPDNLKEAVIKRLNELDYKEDA